MSNLPLFGESRDSIGSAERQGLDGHAGDAKFSLELLANPEIGAEADMLSRASAHYDWAMR